MLGIGLGIGMGLRLGIGLNINYYVKNKIPKCVGIMYNARRVINNTCSAHLYHAYIYPYLIHCIEVWKISLKS